MKVYREGMVAFASKDQYPALKAAGWSRRPPEAEKAEKSGKKKPLRTLKK